jgi:uncharacterized protein involved in outer membrane biogenesis
MKKISIIVLAIFVIVLIVIGGLTLFAGSYLTDERIRSYIIEAAEKSLGRKVTLSTIQVSIFKGITVNSFEIKEKDSAEPFVKAEEFLIKYQLLPLLSKSLVIDEIRLVNSSISLRKNADGSFNFSDITGKQGDKETEKEAESDSDLPVNLQVRSLSLKNTVIEYAEPAGQLSKAKILINADLGIASPSANVISSKGSFSLALAEALLNGNSRPLKDLSAEGTYKITIDLSAKKIDIPEVKAEIAKVPVTMKGNVSYADPLSFALDLNIPETKLAAVQQAVASFLPAGVAFDGAASLAIFAERSSATNNRLTFKGRMAMNSLALSAKGYRPVFNGTIRFTPELISFDSIKLVAGASSADITGQIRNYSAEPDIQMNVTAKNLDIDAMKSPGRKSETGTVAAPSTKKDEKEIEAMQKIKLRAAGSVVIESILVKGISIKNFRTAYEFRNNVLRIPSMTGDTLNGSFRVRSAVDLSRQGTAYTLNTDTNGIKLEDITAAFAPKAKDILYGSLYGRMEFSGSGTLMENIKRNLKGKGAFTVKDGKIKNAKISSGLLAFLGLQDLREIPMDKADSSFTVADSVVNLTSLITSKDLIIDEKGTIGMDERLDLSVLVKASEKLSPKLLSQSSVSQFLSGEKGWTSIPLKVGGAVTKPVYSVDIQRAGKKATETLQKKAEEELFKALSGDKKKKDKAQPQEKKKSDSPEKLLKGLFGN